MLIGRHPCDGAPVHDLRFAKLRIEGLQNGTIAADLLPSPRRRRGLLSAFTLALYGDEAAR
jgi:hypothetical protein